MKKTLLVTIDFPPAVGGVATYWRQVFEGTDGQLIILATPGPDMGGRVIRRPLLFRRGFLRWLRGIPVVWSTYKQAACDQILVGQVLPVGAMAYILHKLFNIPYSVQVYGMDLLMAKLYPRKFRLAKKILASADKIFVNSRAVGAIVKRDYGIEKAVVVVYPVPEKPLPQPGLAKQLREQHGLEGKPVVLTLGRLVERKGQDITLGAMMHVWQTHPEAVYVIAGDGPDRERLERMAEPHKEKVIFTGKLADEEKQAWLELCDIFTMPARQRPGDIEGFGIVYLEAGWHAKPVIGGRSGGVAEAVQDGETGLLVDPENMDEVAAAIIKLLEGPDLARRLGQQARYRLDYEMTWETNLETMKAAL